MYNDIEPWERHIHVYLDGLRKVSKQRSQIDNP